MASLSFSILFNSSPLTELGNTVMSLSIEDSKDGVHISGRRRIHKRQSLGGSDCLADGELYLSKGSGCDRSKRRSLRNRHSISTSDDIKAVSTDLSDTKIDSSQHSLGSCRNIRRKLLSNPSSFDENVFSDIDNTDVFVTDRVTRRRSSGRVKLLSSQSVSDDVTQSQRSKRNSTTRFSDSVANSLVYNVENSENVDFDIDMDINRSEQEKTTTKKRLCLSGIDEKNIIQEPDFSSDAIVTRKGRRKSRLFTADELHDWPQSPTHLLPKARRSSPLTMIDESAAETHAESPELPSEPPSHIASVYINKESFLPIEKRSLMTVLESSGKFSKTAGRPRLIKFESPGSSVTKSRRRARLAKARGFSLVPSHMSEAEFKHFIDNL